MYSLKRFVAVAVVSATMTTCSSTRPSRHLFADFWAGSSEVAIEGLANVDQYLDVEGSIIVEVQLKKNERIGVANILIKGHYLKVYPKGCWLRNLYDRTVERGSGDALRIAMLVESSLPNLEGDDLHNARLLVDTLRNTRRVPKSEWRLYWTGYDASEMRRAGWFGPSDE